MKYATINIQKIATVARVNLAGLRAEQHIDELTRSAILSLSALVACEQQEPYVYSLPASWWQHFKQEVFPQWLLRMFPSKFTSVTLDVKLLYPHLKTQLPITDMGPYVVIAINDRPRIRFMPDTGLDPTEWTRTMQEKAMSAPFAALTRDLQKCPCCGRAIGI